MGPPVDPGRAAGRRITPAAASHNTEKDLGAVDEALSVAALDGRTPRPLVLAGTRGVGKTVILGEAAARAADTYSWLTAPVEIRPEAPSLPQLIEQLIVIRDLYRQSKPAAKISVTGATVRASVLGVGGEVELSRTRQAATPALPLDAALSEACAAAAEHDAGVVITIDELQLAAKRELGDFAATLQQHVPDNWPLVVVLAGLPSIRSTHKGVTYLERAEWHAISLLGREDAVEALQAPAKAAGRPMTDQAAEQLGEASGGYPYAIQLIGHHAWRASAGDATIDVPHVRAAIRDAHEELAAGLYVARWEDSSEREREYLAALAGLSAANERVTGGMVAADLKKTTKAVSWVRDSLIHKGTIFAEGEAIRFAIPGMGDWLRAASSAQSR